MEIRSNMTEEDVITNMLEIAVHLSQMEDDVDTIDIEIDGLKMHFKVWAE